MKREVLAIPAEERGCDVYGAVDGGGVERQREGQEAQRNIPQGKCESEWVERSRGESRHDKSGDQQAEAVDHRQEPAEECKQTGRGQKYAARPEQTADIYREWTDEHQRDVKGAANPSPIVVADSQTALQIARTQRQHPAGERHNSRPHHNTQDSKQGTG